MDEKILDKRRLLLSMIFPLIFVGFLWLVKVVEITADISFIKFGLSPLRKEGLIGILAGPLIHGNWKHLFNNSIPLFFLLWTIFYFYHKIAWKVFVLVYFLSQLWLWFFARDSTHIGASGLVYGFGAFLFVSGVIRRNKNLLAISLLVAFLYGSMVWGLLPIEERISWEGHLMGVIAGIILAYFYKKSGPPLPDDIDLYEDEDENEYDDEDEEPYWMVDEDVPGV